MSVLKYEYKLIHMAYVSNLTVTELI